MLHTIERIDLSSSSDSIAPFAAAATKEDDRGNQKLVPLQGKVETLFIFTSIQ